MWVETQYRGTYIFEFCDERRRRGDFEFRGRDYRFKSVPLKPIYVNLQLSIDSRTNKASGFPFTFY